ncbi:hypothetical protein FISHEDRAFT_56300 [Fistulina hepatica ATCC 64428]|uniref:Uncharacterized protein n=1 Tax=Fistulina hepatica ATCC 64428 TaxID=1128425 RepID=A0A0D7AL94_9AGAR|nr:hypothetical protein FISHEDRAFT_56300 [Fistulina hepatica ATCC 64428]
MSAASKQVHPREFHTTVLELQERRKRGCRRMRVPTKGGGFQRPRLLCHKAARWLATAMSKLGEITTLPAVECTNNDPKNLLPPYEALVEGCQVFVSSYFQLGFIPKAVFLESLANDRKPVSYFGQIHTKLGADVRRRLERDRNVHETSCIISTKQDAWDDFEYIHSQPEAKGMACEVGQA